MLAAFGLLAVCRQAAADAPVFTWNGGGTDGNWTTGGNWGGIAPGSPQNNLDFAGNTRNVLNFGPASVISGPGSVAIKQNSIVLYQSAHIYSGDTFVNAGTLLINSGGSANSSIIRLGDTGSTNAASLTFGANANLNS